MPPLDKIHIRDLKLRCIVGVNPEERVKVQDVVIQITMHVDLRNACRSDDLADTVDYKDTKLRVMKMVEDSSFLLIEKLAEEIAQLCLEDARVQRVNVCVEKPGALRFARTVGIEIERERGE